MGALTEREIFSRLAESFKEAADQCTKLAWNPRRGFIYLEFLKNLRLIEGCCRQASLHREDARWLPLGMMMAGIHQASGGWLRGAKTKDERKKAHPVFQELSEQLRGFQKLAETLRDEATGRIGMILPKERAGPHRDTRPVSVILPGDPRWQH